MHKVDPKDVVTGVVESVARNSVFEVAVKSGEKIIKIHAAVCGRIRKFKIRIAVGDIVKVKLDPSNVKSGQFITGNIIFRERLNRITTPE